MVRLPHALNRSVGRPHGLSRGWGGSLSALSVRSSWTENDLYPYVLKDICIYIYYVYIYIYIYTYMCIYIYMHIYILCIYIYDREICIYIYI